MRSFFIIIIVIALSCAVAILSEEVHQPKKLSSETKHSPKRLARHAFGGYGIAVAYPYALQSTAPIPSGYGIRGPYYEERAYHRHSAAFNRFRSAIIV